MGAMFLGFSVLSSDTLTCDQDQGGTGKQTTNLGVYRQLLSAYDTVVPLLSFSSSGQELMWSGPDAICLWHLDVAQYPC